MSSDLIDRQNPTARRFTPSTDTTKVFTPAQRVQYGALVIAWVALSGYFWLWWLQPAHSGNPVLFTLVSVALFYTMTLLPSIYLFYLGFMRLPVRVTVDEVPSGQIGKVAVMALTVPGSESIEIVRRQMLAMRNITYPHDSWILVDKEPSPAIEKLARELGISYFCRHDERTWGADGVKAWNQQVPPFQTKTKAGNVNAWLDKYGADYTHFTQLDIDHIPIPDYLHRVLGYFRNKRVAWVQAPSVYGNHEHWTARGAAEQEIVLQGPLQMGVFGFCRTPFIIGSHCTYDMAAIRSIGGFQPTRAEDHLDTVVLASKGYEGVFLPEVIAVGDGPETFGSYCAQQFAWAYSMMQILFKFTPRLIRHYSPRQAVQFLFVQTWYVAWSLTTLLLFSAPLISLAADTPISRVGFIDFFLHSWPAALTATGVWLWSLRWQHPKGLWLSWRGVVLHISRWVTVVNAFVQLVLRVKKPYMITSKGITEAGIPRFQLVHLAPHLFLALASLGVCWLYMETVGNSPNQGMLFFALQGALLFWLLTAVVLFQDLRSLTTAGVTRNRSIRARLVPLAASCLLMLLLVVTAVAAAGPIWQAVTSV
ncbi:glycosyltransferase family 2 protein [Arthrobacter sp. NPDC058130]|uniref:glycosyltransferase family 2 protein n=1 Tax=Arthrobacter sp. NPDC058130 TaxID=3346353 RepID=UPI0036DFF862